MSLRWQKLKPQCDVLNKTIKERALLNCGKDIMSRRNHKDFASFINYSRVKLCKDKRRKRILSRSIIMLQYGLDGFILPLITKSNHNSSFTRKATNCLFFFYLLFTDEKPLVDHYFNNKKETKQKLLSHEYSNSIRSGREQELIVEKINETSYEKWGGSNSRQN